VSISVKGMLQTKPNVVGTFRYRLVDLDQALRHATTGTEVLIATSKPRTLNFKVPSSSRLRQ